MSFLDRFRTRDRTVDNDASGPFDSGRADHPVERAPLAEWRSLPAIRTVQRSATPPISLDAGFGQQLVTARTPSFLDHLGHVVSASAPSGLVSGFSALAPATSTRHSDTPTDPRRIDYGPTTVGTLVTPTPPEPMLVRAPMPAVQRTVEVVGQNTPSHEAAAESTAHERPDSSASAPLLGAGGSPLGDESPVPPGFPRPPAHDAHAETHGSPHVAAQETPPAVQLQRAADAAPSGGSPLSVENRPADAPIERVEAAESRDPESSGIGIDRAIDEEVVVPVLSRAPAVPPQRPRIGGPIDAGEHLRRELDLFSSEPVGDHTRAAADSTPRPSTVSGVEFVVPVAPVERATPRHPATHNSVPVQRSVDVAPSASPPGSTDAPPEPVPQDRGAVAVPDQSAAADDPIAPLSSALTLSMLSDESLRAAGPEHRPASAPSVTHPTPALSLPAPSHDAVGSTDVPAAVHTLVTPPRPFSTAESRFVQRRVPETALAADPVATSVENDAPFIRPTIGMRIPGEHETERVAALSPSRNHPSDHPIGTVTAATARYPVAAVQRATQPAPNDRTVGTPVPSMLLASSPSSRSPVSSPLMAAIPPSIMQAVAFASEVTPRGEAAIETFSSRTASTRPADLTSTDAPSFIQRTPVADGRDSPVASPTTIQATNDWLPIQAQSNAATTPATDASPASTSGDADSTAPFSGASEADVIGLMRTMYPHLRRRLSRDLLLERDRAGHRTDIRF